ncbi:MAG: ribose 5-phosphate isomerase B [Phycisphaerales bacterium]|nr:ribose 5-phosphate isomerase B [Phycisphaerales bacterium]
MKIALGSDHRGYDLKQRLTTLLAEMGAEVADLGPHTKESCDYPDAAAAVAHAVAKGEVDRGILMCGTGIGMSITANKVPGIRAALCHDELTAQLSRRHNDANILCLPADLLSEAQLREMTKVWLETGFEGGRHQRRVQKISEVERDSCCE